MLEFLARIFRREKTVEEYYNEGYDAYWVGESEASNPYVEGTVAFSQWDYGWSAAEDVAWEAHHDTFCC